MERLAKCSKVMSKVHDTGNFPAASKASSLLMVYRGKGGMKCPSNYRGMSLLSTLLKIYTWMLAARINDWIERKGIISELQMEFRKTRTTHNTFILRIITDKYLSMQRRKVHWFYIDLQMVFGTLIREALW